MRKKYNYSKQDITEITSKFAKEDLNILVFRDFVQTVKGKDEVLRVYIEHAPTGKYVTGLYRDEQSGFLRYMTNLVSQFRQSL